MVPFCTFFFFFRWTTELYRRIQCPLHTHHTKNAVTLSPSPVQYSPVYMHMDFTAPFLPQHHYRRSHWASCPLLLSCFLTVSWPKSFPYLTCLMSIARWTYLNRADTTVSLLISIFPDVIAFSIAMKSSSCKNVILQELSLSFKKVKTFCFNAVLAGHKRNITKYKFYKIEKIKFMKLYTSKINVSFFFLLQGWGNCLKSLTKDNEED